MPDNIQHLRLVNGEELVVTIISETKTDMTVDNPMLIQERRDELGSSLVLTNYVPFTSKKVCKLKKSHIITLCALHPELVKYYHNSSKISEQYEVKMIEEISKANILMEQLLNQEKEEKWDIPVSRVSKSNNRLH